MEVAAPALKTTSKTTPDAQHRAFFVYNPEQPRPINTLKMSPAGRAEDRSRLHTDRQNQTAGSVRPNEQAHSDAPAYDSRQQRSSV
jgi:hypothetical protein